MKNKLSQQPCAGKCQSFTDEPCYTCLAQKIEKREYELGLAPDDAYVKTAENFLPGDVVVFIDESKTDSLMTVHKVQGCSVLLDGNRNFALSHLIRTVTVAEWFAKRRLSTVEQAVSEVP